MAMYRLRATRLISVSVAAITLSACVTTTTRTLGSYDLSLSSVRRPADAQDRWGDYVIGKSEDGVTYEDELIGVVVAPVASAFALLITNKTDHSLQLLWNEMSYVDVNGFASGVSSGETRLMDVGKSAAPTVIPADAKANLVAVPNSLIKFGVGTSEARVREFLWYVDEYDGLEGKQVELLVPIRVQNTVNEYTFVFIFENVDLYRAICSKGTPGHVAEHNAVEVCRREDTGEIVEAP